MVLNETMAIDDDGLSIQIKRIPKTDADEETQDSPLSVQGLTKSQPLSV